MFDGLLDTDVVIDLLRNNPTARNWFSQQDNIAIPSPVWHEIVNGRNDKQEQEKAVRFLRLFEPVYLQREDQMWAIDQHINLRLSHDVGAFDCLIASVAHRLQIPIFTKNIRHFYPPVQELAVRPYSLL